MHILITNDDGIGSRGLTELAERLSADHCVWIVAPDGERSGMSHSITLRSSMLTKERGERKFSCSGTPADCVNLALSGLLPVTPDLVLSGINHGPNIGTDILYSGTVAGARQAVIRGIPGAAVSVFGYDPPFSFSGAASFVAAHAPELVECWDGTFFYNINAPNQVREIGEVLVTVPARTQYRSETVSFSAPNGDRYHFYRSEPITNGAEPGTDLHAVLQGAVSVSFISAEPTVRGVRWAGETIAGQRV